MQTKAKNLKYKSEQQWTNGKQDKRHLRIVSLSTVTTTCCLQAQSENLLYHIPIANANIHHRRNSTHNSFLILSF